MTSAANNPILGSGGIHHVAVRTDDLNKSIAFYTEVLGMTVASLFDFEDMKFAHLDTGDGSLLELVEDGKPISPADDRNVHWHLCFGCTKIAQVVAAVKAAGYEVTTPETDLDLIDTASGSPKTLPIKIAFFTGPSGEVVELLQEL